MKKLNLKSYWFQSGMFTLLERGTLQVFRFLSFFLIVRGLSKGDFGLWALYLSIATFTEMIRVGLIQHAVVRFLSVHKALDEQRAINTASLVINLLHTALTMLFLLGCGWLLVRVWTLVPLDEMLWVYMIMTLFLVPFRQYAFIQQAHLKFRGIFLATTVRYGSFLGYVMVVHFDPTLSFDLLNLVWAQTICAAAGSLTAMICGWSVAQFSRKVDWAWVRKLFHYGKYVVGTSLGITLIRTIDQLMLGVMVSPVGVASYSTTMRVAHLVEVPIQSIAAIVFPQSARKMENEGIRAVRRLYERSVGVILAMVFPVVLFVLIFPGWLLEFIAGPRYLDAEPLLQVVMFYALLLPFSRQFGTIMDAIGKPRLQFTLLMSGALTNVVLNFLLIHVFGVMGAAYATILTYALILIGSLFLLRREIQVRPMNTLRFTIRLYRKGFLLLWQKAWGWGHSKFGVRDS